MSNITIVAAGGGMSTAYHAGVIKALKEQYNISKVRRIVSSSGAAAIYSYLVSDQAEFIEPMWCYLLESEKFVSPIHHLSGRGVMNIDFLIDDAIKKRYPLDLKALKASSIKLDITVTDSETGKSVVFSKKSELNYYDLLRASCAVPYFYGKHIKLNSRYYCDGTIGDVVGLNNITSIDKKIIIVLTRPSTPIAKIILARKILLWLLLRKEPKELQDKIWSMPAEYNQLYKKINALSEDRQVSIIQPKRKLPIWRIDTSIKRLKRTIEQGYQDTINNKSIEMFFDPKK